MVRRRPTVRPAQPATKTPRIMGNLRRQHPKADAELRFENAFQLLAATILSAQCTDERVNEVAPALFTAYPDAASLAAADEGALEVLIKSTGFYRSKARSRRGMAASVVADHAGTVPQSRDALITLSGVGRKTANVVLGHAMGEPAMPVDRHVLRVANRLGIARGDDPERVEEQLCAVLPRRGWTRASDTLILHGRRVCKPKPLCDRCSVQQECAFIPPSTPPTKRRTRR
tara:strand:- start:1012 stop:1701 length:690 start_codon:yes stop_codon:yes gene_type:complete